jgi:hypothetical protein
MAGRNIEKGGDAKAADYLSRCFAKIGILPVMGMHYYQTFNYQTFAMDGKVLVQLGHKMRLPQIDYRITDYSASLHQRLKIIRSSPLLLLKKNREELQRLQQKISKSRKPVAVYLNFSKSYKILTTDEQQEFQQVIGHLRYHNPFQSEALLIEDDQFPVQSLAGSDYVRNFTTVYLRTSMLKRYNRYINIDLNNERTSFTTQNICALEQGETDSLIVFTAHYDHLGTMGDQLYYPGAHDNASGCAAVLDLARYFHNNKLKYSVLYIFFSGEESGLLGSQFFVDNPPINLSKIKLLINLDMMCGGTEGLMLENVMSIDSGCFYQNLVSINEQYQFHKELKQRTNSPNSDHYPFTLKGVPAIFIYTLGGRHGGYHSPDDTCDHCGLEEYERTIRLIIEGVKKI